MYKSTIEFLEKEVKNLTEARDGIGKAFNLLERQTGEKDSRLIELYNKFDYQLKDHKNSIEVLEEELLKLTARK